MDHIPENFEQRPVLIVGAGTLGRRIALMFAAYGADTRLYDANEQAGQQGLEFIGQELEKMGKDKDKVRLTPFSSLEEAVSDIWLAIECIPERRDIKVDLFAQLDELAPQDAVLSTNSSSFPSSQVIDRVKHPERVMNTHFLMPPDVVAVELMSCGKTLPEVIELVEKALPKYGFNAYVAHEESVGFIFNRIWAAIKRESLTVAAEGVASPEVIDNIFRECLGTRSGPFRSMDKVGLDVVLDIETHYAELNPALSDEPRKFLKTFIDKNELGRKTGKGFYDDYSE
ncbi:3-hydroxyacyl-CoA dehydrogenase family protein [Carnimonas bestiolae]|uniref:3-hydroxyacyl-CoA dehydrogenase family protein n=1 Tax=Carnimonas bestiolae TaxID=3402172 RepID=UPI003EDB76E2